MIKTKDGYAKLIGTTYSGSVSRVLLSNGGDHILGNSNGNIPLNNGTVNTNLNADMLDGLHIHTGRNKEANKIVRTDASGYILAGWINTTSGDIGTGAINKIYCSNDDYIRYKTPANFFPTLANDGNQISITIGSQNRKLTVNYASFTKTLDKVSLPSSTSNATNTAWCKFARITFNNSAWSAASGYLFFGGGENPDNRAILVYHFRSGNTATTLSTANLYWLVKSYSNATVIAVKAADNVYDLYTNNSGTYMSPCIYHMSAFSNRFTWSIGNWTTTKPTAAYTSSDIGIVNYANSAGNADTLNSYHANGLLTALSNANNGVSITVGGTTKSISNISVSYAKYLNSVNRMDYGWNGINYFNANLTAGCAAKVNDSPTSNWWHILRFNHNDSSGYYTDLAVPFNSNSLYWKTVRKGSVAYDHWIKVLDSLNYNEFTPTKKGVGASGTWGISITGNADTVDGYHASKFPYINDNGVWKVYGNSAAAALADNTAGLSAWAFGETRNSRRTYLGILKPSVSTCGISAHGTIVVFGQGNTHLGIASDYGSANLQVFGGNADKIVWRKKVAFTSDIPTVTNYWWANVKISNASNTDTLPTFGFATIKNRLSISSSTITKTAPIHLQLVINGPNLDSSVTPGLKDWPGIGFRMPNRGWASLIYNGNITAINSNYDGYINYFGAGFKKNGSSDSYVLLGGGGHKLISDFAVSGHVHNYLALSGGTMTGVIKSTFKSGSWINGVTNAVVKGEYTDYGAILSMPVKDGRVSLSSYPSSDNFIYFGYASFAQISAGTNNFNKLMRWDAANNNLYADKFTGALAGNASTASKWATARTLTLTGAVTGSVSIDGSRNVSLATTTNHTHNYIPLSGSTAISGKLRFNGEFAFLGYLPRKKEGSDSWAYEPFSVIDFNGSNFAHFGVYGSANSLEYIYIGAKGYNSNSNLKIYTNGTASASGFKKNGSNDTYVLLGGGGHKLISDFATAGHNHNSSYVSAISISGNYLRVTKNGTNSDLTIPFATTASKWATARTLTIGNTGKSVDGSVNVSWTLAEIGAATSGHTHTLSLASDTGTSSITLTHGGKYKLTAGGGSVIFTLPTDITSIAFSGGHISSSGNTLTQADHSIAIGGQTETAGYSTCNIINSLSINSLSSSSTTNLAAKITVNGITSAEKTITNLHSQFWDVTRSSTTSNISPGANSATITEVQGNASGITGNLPTDSWYHVYTATGQETKYATLLALGMTTDGIWYRKYSNSSWGSWLTVLHSGNIGNYYWANISISSTRNTNTTPQFGKVKINTTSSSYQLNVEGDSYTTGWSRAKNGFYCEGNGIYFTHNGTKGEITVKNNNEFCWGSNSDKLYFNYTAPLNGTPVKNYIWNAGSSNTYASHTTGDIILGSDSNNNYQLKRVGSLSDWYNGRDKAIIRETSAAGYHTLWSLKTTDGSWDFGEHNAGSGWNNVPVLSYITDSNYNSGNNTPTYQIKFPLASGTVALTSFGGDYKHPIFLGYLNLDHGNDGTVSSSFSCLGYTVPFTYTRGGNYCRIYIPNTSYQTFYIRAAIASVNYSGGGMDTWVGDHRGDGAWWLHCYAYGPNEVRVKGFCLRNTYNDSWWGGNPLWSDSSGADRITVCIFGNVI